MSTTTSAADFFPSAELDRRFYAFTLDRLLAWSIYGLAAWAAWVLLLEKGAVAAGVAVIVGTVLVVSLVLAFVLGLLGTSPGKAAVGLRVVDDTTGTPIGVGPALLRTLVLGVATLPTFGIGVAALAWTAVMDRDHQRRGWHDHRARSVVVDVRPVPAQQESAPEQPQQIVNLTAMRLLPASPTPPREVPTRVRRSRWAAGPTTEAGPTGGPAVTAEGLLEHAAGTPTPGPSDEVTLAAPARPPVPAPTATQPATAPVLPPVAPVPQATRAAAEAPVQPVPPVAPEEPRTGPAQPADPAARAAPAVAATPPATPSGGKRAARGPTVPARWRVGFDTGEEFVVAGFTLVGRNPEPRPGEAVKRLLALPSADMSLSKTHAQFQVVPDGALVVMDRGSTNGSLLIRGGVTRELAAGKPASLRDGDVVRFGDREMRVVREQ